MAGRASIVAAVTAAPGLIAATVVTTAAAVTGSSQRILAGFDRPRVIATLRTALAALVALLLANTLGIDSPGWAAMTVFLVSQPTRGLLKARSFYRVAGTVVGALVGAGLIVVTGGSPAWLVLSLAAWLGLCCWLGNLAQPLRAYGFMLSGYTAGIVALLSVGHQGGVTHLAVDRVEGVLLGALVAVAANGLFTPRSVTLDRLDSVPTFVSDTLGWAARMIAHGSSPALLAEEQARVRQMADIEFGLDEAAFGSRRKQRRVAQVRGVFSALLSLASSTRTVAEHLDRVATDPTLQTWRADVHHGLHAVQTALEAGQPAHHAVDPLRALVLHAPRHSRLAFALQELIAALDAMVGVGYGGRVSVDINAGSNVTNSANANATGRAARHADEDSFVLHPHRDWAGARIAALRTVLVILVLGSIWAMTGWTYGPYMVMGAAVFLPLFSTMETPSAIMRNVALGSIAGVSAAVLFTWLVLPHIHNEVALLAAVGAALATGAFALAHRSTLPYALDYCMGFLLVLHPAWPMHTTLADTIGGAQAMTIGLAAAWLAFRYIAPVDPARRLHGLVRHIVGDIERLAHSRTRLPEWKWRARMHHRILRLVARTGDAQASQAVGEGLAALQVGQAVLRLQSLMRAEGMSFEVRTAATGAIRALSRVSHHPANAASAMQEVARQIALAQAADRLGRDPLIDTEPNADLLHDAATSLLAHRSFFAGARRFSKLSNLASDHAISTT